MKTLRDVFDNKMLTELISQFPPVLTITYKSKSLVTVKTQTGKKLISAISRNGKQWSVQAQDNMFDANCYWSSN